MTKMLLLLDLCGKTSNKLASPAKLQMEETSAKGLESKVLSCVHISGLRFKLDVGQSLKVRRSIACCGASGHFNSMHSGYCAKLQSGSAQKPSLWRETDVWDVVST
jgi:hypothetical protein